MRLPPHSQPSWEYCKDSASDKSVLLVRLSIWDINSDRVQSKYFVAYNVPCPKDDELPEVEPIELTAQYSQHLAMEMLRERVCG
jgi:hypothetical protein